MAFKKSSFTTPVEKLPHICSGCIQSKHGCEGKQWLDRGKAKFLLVLFCMDSHTYAMKKHCWDRDVENWIPFVCLPDAHWAHTCVNLCECAVHPSMHTWVYLFFRVRVCLRSRLPVCLCEFCKLFTALAVSIHCWWQWKVCLIVVVLQWKFNSAPFRWEKKNETKQNPSRRAVSSHTCAFGVQLWRLVEQR